MLDLGTFFLVGQIYRPSLWIVVPIVFDFDSSVWLVALLSIHTQQLCWCR